MAKCEYRVLRDTAAENATHNLYGEQAPQGAFVAGHGRYSDDLCQIAMNMLSPTCFCVYPKKDENTCPIVIDLKKKGQIK